MTTIKICPEQIGAHIETRVFVGSGESSLAFAGRLTMRPLEWREFAATLLAGADRMPDGFHLEIEGYGEEILSHLREIGQLADAPIIVDMTNVDPESKERWRDELPHAMAAGANMIRGVEPGDVAAQVAEMRAAGATIVGCSFCATRRPPRGDGPRACPFCGTICHPLSDQEPS